MENSSNTNIGQTLTSKNTCTNFNKPNKLYKYLPPTTRIVFDYGCGKYPHNENSCKEKGIEWYGYDPYWKTKEENELFIQKMDEYKKSYKAVNEVVFLCSNVLNVIDSEKEIDNIMKLLYEKGQVGSIYLFSCYRGSSSGIGKQTKKDCWQRNEKPLVWKKRFEKYFSVLYIVDDIFICRKDT